MLRFLDKLEMTCAQASFGRALDKLEMTCARVSSRACREISPCAALSRDDRAARVCTPMFSPKNLHFHLKFSTFVGKYREIWNLAPYEGGDEFVLRLDTAKTGDSTEDITKEDNDDTGE